MIIVAAFYHFADFKNYQDWQKPIQTACYIRNIKGILLLASEGINGTIAGKQDDIDFIIRYIRHIPIFKDCEVKYSHSDVMPFYRMKVRLKKEIVTLGMPNFNPNDSVGQYVEAENWNDLISDPNTIVIDTRNHYEVHIGQFDNAINPETEKFTDFPKWVTNNHHRLHNKTIAMYCTGGIRCEKASAYMLSQGYKNVFHLKGGILKYLEQINHKDSLWQGDCFVFDHRVAVKQGLELSDYDLCGGCRHPISPHEKLHDDFIEGVSCHHCAHNTSDDQKSRYQERQKQIILAAKNNKPHLGC